MEKNKSNNLAVCIICGVLTVFGIVASIISLVSGSKGIWMVTDTACIVLAVLAGYYVIFGYKRPHGNILKYTILIYSVVHLIILYTVVLLGETWRAVLNTIIIAVLCYIIGRLHRVKQNIILMGIVTVLMVIVFIIGFVERKSTLGALTLLIIWLDICVAYFLRYKEHKEAGLLDKVKE